MYFQLKAVVKHFTFQKEKLELITTFDDSLGESLSNGGVLVIFDCSRYNLVSL